VRVRRTASRWSDASGALSTEYVAVLVLVAALMTALFALPRLVGDAAEQAADCLFTADSCEITPGDGSVGEPSGETSPDTTPAPRPDGAPPLDRTVTHGSDGPTREEGDIATGDVDVDIAYDAMQVWGDYLWVTYGRDSIDGEGAPLLADVQTQDPDTANARWDRDEQMTYYRDGWLSPSVLHHEFAHGLVQWQTGGLRSGRTGDAVQTWALNEALADIHAMNVTREGMLGHDLPDRDDPVRSSEDPGSTSNPDHVDQYHEAAGGHANSTIISHAYWLMTQDIGWEASEQIVFLAVEEHVDQDVRFEDFRRAMLQAAEELYGADSDERRGVEEAFGEVGLDGSWTGP
jgi:Zn-dependent metalloprotease